MKATPLRLATVLLALGLMLIALPSDAQETASEEAPPAQKAGGVKSLELRIQQLEEAIDREVVSDKWYDRLQISGLIEVEAGYLELEDKKNPTADTQGGVAAPAPGELGVVAKIAGHVDGPLMF